MALDYAGRCQRYARQRGWAYDPKRMSIGHLTPRQRRRAMHKERHQGYDGHGTPRRADATPAARTARQRSRRETRQAVAEMDRLAAAYLDDDYDGHSPADEYFIWPRDDSPSYRDTFAY